MYFKLETKGSRVPLIMHKLSPSANDESSHFIYHSTHAMELFLLSPGLRWGRLLRHFLAAREELRFRLGLQVDDNALLRLEMHVWLCHLLTVLQVDPTC